MGLKSSVLALVHALRSNGEHDLIHVKGLVDPKTIEGLRNADLAAYDAISSQLASGDLELKSSTRISWPRLFKHRGIGLLKLFEGDTYGT